MGALINKDGSAVPEIAAQIAQRVFNALGAPMYEEDVSFGRVRTKRSYNETFGRFAPLYEIQSFIPSAREFHSRTPYNTYLQTCQELVKKYIGERNGRRFAEGEMTLIKGAPIATEQQIALFST